MDRADDAEVSMVEGCHLGHPKPLSNRGSRRAAEALFEELIDPRSRIRTCTCSDTEPGRRPRPIRRDRKMPMDIEQHRSQSVLGERFHELLKLLALAAHSFDSMASDATEAPRIAAELLTRSDLSGRTGLWESLAGERAAQNYWMCTPEMARAITRRWISEVPSKMV
jgi:hypothetical protein